MAVPLSPSNRISPTINHLRRHSASNRYSSSSSTSSIPTFQQNVSSPRILCPPDGDAFSYHPSHLPAWYMPQDLWARLPEHLLKELAALQHAGAAVLTGLHRLKDLEGGTQSRNDAGRRSPNKAEAEVTVPTVDDHLSSVSTHPEKPKSRHDSAQSSSSNDSLLARPITAVPGANPTTSLTPPLATVPDSPRPTISPLPFPISPWTLNPLDPPSPSYQPPQNPLPSPNHPTHRRTLSSPPTQLTSTPSSQAPSAGLAPTNPFAATAAGSPLSVSAKDPHTSRYLAELTTLRSESLVRLRHAMRKVEGEWIVSQHEGDVELVKEGTAKEFEAWWREKRDLVRELEGEVGRRLEGSGREA